MEFYILISGVFGISCLIIAKFLPKKKNDNTLTDKEENVLSVFKDYGESKDDYIIVSSREVTSTPTAEDEERWIKEDKYYNSNGLEEEEEEDEELWKDENLDRSKSTGIKNRLDWKKNVEVRDFNKTTCCNDDKGNMIKPLCKKLYESKINYKRSEIEKMSFDLGYSVYDNVGNAINKEGGCGCSCRWRSIISN